MKVLEIKSEINKGSYLIREEIWAPSFKGEEPQLMTSGYTPDGQYLSNEKCAKFLCEEKGLIYIQKTDPNHSVCSIGYQPEEKKWYGWSHRAIYGFGVGDSIKRGDCAYAPVDLEDARLEAIRFWSEDSKSDVTAKVTKDEDGKDCFEVSWVYDDTIQNGKLHNKIGGCRHYPPEDFGRGEWTAKNLSDAKQMAMDFAGGVS